MGFHLQGWPSAGACGLLALQLHEQSLQLPSHSRPAIVQGFHINWQAGLTASTFICW